MVEAAKAALKSKTSFEGGTTSSREKPETQIPYFAEFWLLL